MTLSTLGTPARAWSQARGAFDAADVLSLYAALLLLVPANLIVGPLGAVGTPANLFGIVCIGWWCMTRLTPQLGIAMGPQPIRWALIIFGTSILASYLAFSMRASSGLEVNSADRGILLLLAWAGPALVAADGLRTMADVDRLLKRVVAFAAILAAAGIVEFFTGFELRSRYKVPGLIPNHEVGSIAGEGVFARVAGTATHPIEFGVVLAVLLPIVVHYALAARPDRARRWWIALGLVAVAIPMAISRSAILSLFGAAIVMLSGWSSTLRRRAFLALVGFMTIMQFAIPGLLGTLRSLFANYKSDNSYKGRTDDYSVVGQFIGERPIIGRGFKTFLMTLDNQWLGIIVELGFVGLFAVIAFLAISFFTARGARRRSSDIYLRNLAQALAASTVAACVGFFTFDFLAYSMVSGVMFLLAGCAGALWRIARVEQSPEIVENAVPHAAIAR